MSHLFRQLCCGTAAKLMSVSPTGRVGSLRGCGRRICSFCVRLGDTVFRWRHQRTDPSHTGASWYIRKDLGHPPRPERDWEYRAHNLLARLRLPDMCPVSHLRPSLRVFHHRDGYVRLLLLLQLQCLIFSYVPVHVIQMVSAAYTASSFSPSSGNTSFMPRFPTFLE